MKASVKRILLILLSAIFIITAILVFIKMVIPSYQEVIKLKGELLSRTKLLAEQTSIIEEFIQVAQQEEDIQKQQEILSKILPVEESIPQAIHLYQTVAESCGVSINSLSVKILGIKPSKKGSIAKGIGTLRFDMKIFGTYEAIKKFSEILETSIQLNDLINIKMEKADVPEENLYVQELTVDTYYQAQ